jgi:SH3-like domain-containing protein
MKKISLILLFVFTLSSCQNTPAEKQNVKKNAQLQNAEKIINETREIFVPDKRDHIFNVAAKTTGDKIIITGTTDFSKAVTHLKNQLLTHKIKFVDSVQYLPIKDFQNKMAVVRLSVANLRAKPKHSAELVTQALMGMPLRVLQEKNGFYQVQTPEGYYAWVDAAGIVIKSKKDFLDWLKKPKVIVTAMFGMLSSNQKNNTHPISDYVLNNVFAVDKSEKKITKVIYPDGRTGNIDNNCIESLEIFNKNNSKKEQLQSNIVNFASNYIGIPYLWGDTSAKALDCSGFTKNVYAQTGYLLPRDASQQVKIGKKIEITDDFSNLQPGDLLFFGRIKNGKEKITHVAIHLNKGKIIHETGEVKIESLNPKDKDYNEYRSKSLLQARRIVGYIPQTFSKAYTE